MAGGLRDRFIPARAGNTREVPQGGCPSPVHPRAGGEHARYFKSPRTSGTVHPRAGGEHLEGRRRGRRLVGSSPRGRGTPLRHSPLRLPYRFIPARAGNTAPGARHRGRRPVHPRAGGEHGVSSTHSATCAGSSPRGRGTRLRQRRADVRARFIPARAGNTEQCCEACSPPPVHPRAGGEHSRRIRVANRFAGSSPRGRGTLLLGRPR